MYFSRVIGPVVIKVAPNAIKTGNADIIRILFTSKFINYASK